MVSIRYFTPAASLRRFLSSYYWFEAEATVIDDLIRAELGQVRFIVAGDACYDFGERMIDCPPSLLTGPTSKPVRFVANGPLRVFGAGLMPEGWAALIGLPADSVADDAIDLAAFAGPAARHCLDAMLSAGDDAGRVAAANCFFTALSLQARVVPRWFTRLADDWLTDSTNPQVDTLVAASGMSARQIERMTARIYGAPPKLLARKYRALQAAVRLGNGEADGWADAAGDAFYDQSHFIREFKQFVGLTPSRFATEQAPISRLTISRRRLLPTLPKLAYFS